ncbi:hypothetical protein [Virgisporangium aurantiacum]|uniref:RHS repeat-associated core domain-containing protein n=1 Tax=Virgisporangium aurantiacum TaxID=175570 RepID=A0A8J3ZI35_9ACTN|nr:hypothetical protein [Virgisporangium aurantiacum]GIJ62310.1 hypothetical protein Vau01_098260 [Virgisporangium aurantiacum]
MPQLIEQYSYDNAPSQAVVGGPDPYWTSYTYNSIGNRTSDTVHTAGGNTVRTYAYPRSGATSVRPHATTGVTVTGLNPGSHSYGYDNEPLLPSTTPADVSIYRNGLTSVFRQLLIKVAGSLVDLSMRWADRWAW